MSLLKGDNEPNLNDVMTMLASMNNCLKELDQKMKKILAEVGELKQENKQLRKINTKQQNRILQLEREVKKKNIIIKGVVDEEQENNDNVNEKIKNLVMKMGINIGIAADTEELVNTLKEEIDRF